jgi:hypothetical protein
VLRFHPTVVYRHAFTCAHISAVANIAIVLEEVFGYLVWVTDDLSFN